MLLLKSPSGSPVLLGQVQISAWGGRGPCPPPGLYLVLLCLLLIGTGCRVPLIPQMNQALSASGPLLKRVSPGMLFSWLLVPWLLVFLLLLATMSPPQGSLP